METHTPDSSTELHDAVAGTAGAAGRAEVDRACERMDRRRDELRRRYGEFRLSADLIREVREP